MSAALKAIHAGARALGLDEDGRRDLMARVTGKRSAGEMSEDERSAVVAEMRRLGFEASSKARRSPSKTVSGPYGKKLQALWIAGWNLGVVRSADDAALIAFVKRQTGLSHERFLRDPADAARAIEALKSWLAREADVDWSDGLHLPVYQRLPGYKIALAQATLLAINTSDFRNLCLDLSGKAFLGDIEPRDWMVIMNALGKRVREAKEAKG